MFYVMQFLFHFFWKKKNYKSISMVTFSIFYKFKPDVFRLRISYRLNIVLIVSPTRFLHSMKKKRRKMNIFESISIHKEWTWNKNKFNSWIENNNRYVFINSLKTIQECDILEYLNITYSRIISSLCIVYHILTMCADTGSATRDEWWKLKWLQNLHIMVEFKHQLPLS